MGERHWCEPPYYPSCTSERWTCPECGRVHRAYDVHAESARLPEVVLKHVPAGTLGWTTHGAGDLSDTGGRVEP